MFTKAFAKVSVFAAVFLTSTAAMAQSGVTDYGYWLPIGIALGIGMAALGGTLGQGRAASAALEGIARNPNAADKVFVPMILGLVFIESLVLFTWVLMLLMQLKMG